TRSTHVARRGCGANAWTSSNLAYPGPRGAPAPSQDPGSSTRIPAKPHTIVAARSFAPDPGSARRLATLAGARPGHASPYQRRGSVLAADVADVFSESGELLLDEVDRGLILELELVVEFGLCHADEHLRSQEHVRVEKYKDLTPLILDARSPQRPAGRRLDCNRLVLERLILEPREPVDRVLQPARQAGVVFPRNNDDAVGLADRVGQRLDRGREPGGGLIVGIVDRKATPRRRRTDSHSGRRKLGQRARQRGIERALAERPVDRNDVWGIGHPQPRLLNIRASSQRRRQT